MTNTGNITKAEWLYEANYPQWKERMTALKALKDFDAPPNDFGYDLEVLAISQEITPYFLGRIPDSSRSTTWQFLRVIEEHAHSFPLLMLPPEIRIQIYRHFFDYHNKCRYGGDEGLGLRVYGDGSLEPSAIAPILAVSRDVRRKALPVFFSRSTFYVEHEDTSYGELAPALCLWTKGLKTGVRHLREMRVQPELYLWDYDYLFDGDVVLAFSPQAGLHIHKCDGMADDWAAQLQTHVPEVEASRKALGLQGESIIMAFTTRTELWDFDSGSFAAQGPT
ncbi:hypothetical protein LTR15_006216 [Elasticomyces elasticus]|nr:hypothetical protein LTR15_006216 [Elasticomyces elasticus]